MARAQIIGEVFVFVLALVIFSGVLLYGYRAIFSVQEGVEDSAFVSFYEGLKNKVEQVGIDYGSVKKYEASPPGGFKEVCFLDLDKLERNEQESLDALRASHPLIADAVESGTDQNLFFTPLAKTPTKLGKLAIDGGFACFNIEDAELELRLQGLGDRTKVSEWQ